MTFDIYQSAANILVITLVYLPVFLVTWLATKRYKAEDLKINFSKPRKEALYSIVVVVSIAVILTVYIFLLYKNASGAIGTPTQFTLNSALFQWGLYGVLFMLPVLAAVKLRRQGLETLGITKKNAWFSITVGTVLAAAFIVFIALTGGGVNFFSTNAVWALIYFAAVGFGEELLFRGYLQNRCVSWLGGMKGLVVASTVMAFIHVPQRMFAVGLDPIQAVLSAVALLPVSLALGFVMLRTKNIAGSTVLHTAVDWVSNI